MYYADGVFTVLFFFKRLLKKYNFFNVNSVWSDIENHYCASHRQVQ